jgi:site-specific DNA-methyltransferase (cytosine-N4-specific)
VTASVELAGEAAATYRRLLNMDWTFERAKTRGETHGIHPYPAKFIPQIPRALIAALYPGDGSVVLDPFCGSGTTLVEAAAAGAPAVGVDLHPLACLISKVKVTPLRVSLSAAAERVASVARRSDSLLLPQIPGVDHWFKLEIQVALAGLLRAIAAEADEDLRDALRVALSSIVVRVSNQESDTRYAAIEKLVSPASVVALFLRAAHSLDRSVSETWPGLLPTPRVDILNRDILTVRPEDISRRVSLVVTSPPYPNAYEYWLYHKYRMYWLGMDPIAVRAREIGARPNYFKRNPQSAADFEHQMGDVFGLLSQVMVGRGHACFQVGNSVIRGELIDNAALLRRAAEPRGFRPVAEMSREIPAHRKAFNASHARIKVENLIVFRLDT